jgi:hypothetical protein
MRLYPDRMTLRLAYGLADLLAVAWATLWLGIGRFVYDTVMALSVLARSIVHAGQVINLLIAGFEQESRQTLPLLGDWLAGVVHQMSGSGSPLIGFGQAGLVAIHSLAVTLALLIAAPPLLAGVLTYLPWRWRRTREFASLHVAVRRAMPMGEEEILRILAARALYTLPFHTLLSYSRNPIAEFAAGHYENLARATMDQQGLHLHRYLALPTVGDGDTRRPAEH